MKETLRHMFWLDSTQAISRSCEHNRKTFQKCEWIVFGAAVPRRPFCSLNRILYKWKKNFLNDVHYFERAELTWRSSYMYGNKPEKIITKAKLIMFRFIDAGKIGLFTAQGLQATGEREINWNKVIRSLVYSFLSAKFRPISIWVAPTWISPKFRTDTKKRVHKTSDQFTSFISGYSPEIGILILSYHIPIQTFIIPRCSGFLWFIGVGKLRAGYLRSPGSWFFVCLRF